MTPTIARNSGLVWYCVHHGIVVVGTLPHGFKLCLSNTLGKDAAGGWVLSVCGEESGAVSGTTTGADSVFGGKGWV